MSQIPQQPLREPRAPMRETPASASREAPTDGSWRKVWARNLAIAAAAGVFFALAAPFGTGAAPLTLRLAYWVPLLLAGELFGEALSRLAQRFIGDRINPFLFAPALAVVMTAPSAVAVWAYTGLMFEGGLDPARLPGFAAPVLVMCLAMSAIMTLVNAPGRLTHAAPAGAERPRFLERLPAKLKGAVLYAVAAEDHYLRLYTSKGADLILMRLADAIAELDGLEGAQTHRSWWVARDAVEGARRKGDRAVLMLKGGVEAPVSRPNVRPLREAGWFT